MVGGGMKDGTGTPKDVRLQVEAPAGSTHLQADCMQADCQAYCPVCFEGKPLKMRNCCGFSLCDDCLTRYVIVNAAHARISGIKCPLCEENMARDEVCKKLGQGGGRGGKGALDGVGGRWRSGQETPHDDRRRRCPNCRKAHVFRALLFRSYIKGNPYTITCSRCHAVWCFRCGSPRPKGRVCRCANHTRKHQKQWLNDMEESDPSFRKWASQKKRGGLPRARSCPSCGVFLEWAAGCVLITCPMCRYHFCYVCGNEFTATARCRHTKSATPAGNDGDSCCRDCCAECYWCYSCSDNAQSAIAVAIGFGLFGVIVLVIFLVTKYGTGQT